KAPPLGVDPLLVALLERGVLRQGVRGGIEDRRVAVGVDERRGEVLAGEALDLGEDALRGVDVHLVERAGAQDRLTVEQLEEVELDVAQIALVVAHGPLTSGRMKLPVLLAGSTGQ